MPAARASGPPTLAPSLGVATVAPATRAPESSPTPDPPAPSLGEPPAATLAAEGGDPVAGSLGSFTWGDGGSDSPWLPGAPITVAGGEPLTVGIAAAVPVSDWTAKRVPAGTPDGIGAVAIADGRVDADRLPGPRSGQLVGAGGGHVRRRPGFGRLLLAGHRAMTERVQPVAPDRALFVTDASWQHQHVGRHFPARREAQTRGPMRCPDG